MKESNLHRMIMIEAVKHGHRLFRNNVGKVEGADGRYHVFGLCVGSSDLIGWTRDGRFAAIEVKLPGRKATREQMAFIDAVIRAGGRAGVATSPAEAVAIMETLPSTLL